MEQFWQAALAIAGLGAIGSFVFLSLYRGWLHLGIFAQLTKGQTFTLMCLFLILTFLALLAILATYAITRNDRVPSSAKANIAQNDSSEQMALPGFKWVMVRG